MTPIENAGVPEALGTSQIIIGDRPIRDLISEVQGLYCGDGRPWVIGYSGGKDSTAILRLVYQALLDLEPERRRKPVFVVSSDTLVETPIVVDLITETLNKVQHAALITGLPITTAQVVPNIQQTFWVNLLGKGYPAPTRQFRWCTERMKIDPVSEFITKQVAQFGEVVCVLGSRVAESASRSQVMKKHKIEGMRLAKHSTLPSAYVYTPIEDWSADDVWEFLFSGAAPWGGDHQALFDLYKDSNAGECPLVIDTTTPSCGNSRFGCWVCTVVTKDKAMDGLVESGHEWLVPLQEFRNELYNTTIPANKNKYRNVKKRTGKIQVLTTGENKEIKHVPGPYWLDYRRTLLRKLLEIQKATHITNPDIQLITKDELHEIRRFWLQDPNEPDWEDSLPRIYREVTGDELEGAESDAGAFTKVDAEILGELEVRHGVPAALLMKLIELEVSLDGLSRRSAIFERIDQILRQDWGNYEEVLNQRRESRARVAFLSEEERELLSIHAELEAQKKNAD